MPAVQLSGRTAKYEQFKHLVLISSSKIINEKNECLYDYTPSTQLLLGLEFKTNVYQELPLFLAINDSYSLQRIAKFISKHINIEIETRDF